MRVYVQINFLPKFADQLTSKKQNLLLKTGLILIIIICSTSEVVVSRIAEEEDAEPTSELQTPPPTDTTQPRQRVSTADPDASETSMENRRYTEFGLSTGNPFDSGTESKHFIWQDDTEQPAEELDPAEAEEDPLIQPYLDSLRKWRYAPYLTDFKKLYDGAKAKGMKRYRLPMILT